MRGGCDKKEGDVNFIHPLPRVWGCGRGSGITKRPTLQRLGEVFRKWIKAWVSSFFGRKKETLLRAC